jgi:hypothetical protein
VTEENVCQELSWLERISIFAPKKPHVRMIVKGRSRVC